jgi:hypothetical protein
LSLEQTTGSAIYYYGDLDTVNHGLTTITFDGKDTVISISTSSGYQCQAVLFQRTGLENTTHGLIITQSDHDGLFTTIDRIMSVLNHDLELLVFLKL